MKNVNSIVPEVKDFEELKAIINDGKRDEMCAHLGTFLAKSASDKAISDKSYEMLPKIAIWKQNWENLQNGTAPLLEEIRAKEVDDLLETLGNKLSPDQIQKLATGLQAKVAA